MMSIMSNLVSLWPYNMSNLLANYTLLANGISRFSWPMRNKEIYVQSKFVYKKYKIYNKRNTTQTQLIIGISAFCNYFLSILFYKFKKIDREISSKRALRFKIPKGKILVVFVKWAKTTYSLDISGELGWMDINNKQIDEMDKI